MSAVSKRFDFLANGVDLLFSGLRLHHYEHREYPEISSVASGGEQGKRWAEKWKPEDMVPLVTQRTASQDQAWKRGKKYVGLKAAKIRQAKNRCNARPGCDEPQAS